MALGGTKNLDEMVSSASCSSRPLLQEKKVRPHKEQALNCPRCNSTNTKFCYYNNYSLSQPRYFCKTCRRYWTEGGSLRNVPVGGGSRKNKRSITKKLSDLAAPNSSSLDPSSVLNQRNHDGKDLNLGMFPAINQMGLPTTDVLEYDQNPFSSSSSSLTAFDLMRSSGFVRRSLMSSFAPVQDPNHYGASGFGMNDFRSLSLDGYSSYGNLQGVSDNGKLSIAFEDVKPAAAHHLDLDQNRSQVEASGYWGGILGGASWPQVPNYGL